MPSTRKKPLTVENGFSDSDQSKENEAYNSLLNLSGTKELSRTRRARKTLNYEESPESGRKTKAPRKIRALSPSSDSDQSKENKKTRTPKRNSELIKEADIINLLGETSSSEDSSDDEIWKKETPTPNRKALVRKARKTLSYEESPEKAAGAHQSEPKVSPIKIRRKISPEEIKPRSPERTLRTRGCLKRPFWMENDLEIYKSPKSSPVRSPRPRIPLTPKTPKSLRQQVLEANTPTSARKKLPLATPESQKSGCPPSPDENFATPDSKTTTPTRRAKAEPKTPTSSARKRILTTPSKGTPSTPSSVRRAGRGFLTPIVGERSRRIPGTPSTEIDLVRSQLHISAVPTSLPCREKEFTNIQAYVLRKLQDQAGGCMYISGVPGTGKTATVHAVVRELQDRCDKKLIPAFDFVEVNGLRLTEPRQAYVRILQSLTGQKTPSEQAHRQLETKFSGRNKRSTVLLVDELDYLCNRRQDVIYNILDWSTMLSSKLIVLTIANTMDLPERTLKGKVTSRMGLTRLVFQPYTYQQLQQIVQNRLEGTSTFHPDAVQLVSRKVAAVSGDARRALDICRKTTDLVKDGEMITVVHVEKALSQIFSGTRVLAIKNCGLMEQLVLRSTRDETQRTGVEETTVGSVFSHLVSLCALEGVAPPLVGDVLNICSNLARCGLVLAEKPRADINRKLSLNVSPDDIHYALHC